VRAEQPEREQDQAVEQKYAADQTTDVKAVGGPRGAELLLISGAG
jgi:hypothetical protein